MNTNNNTYTVIYTTVICVLVAAILALVSQSLKPRQEANEKAETASQILAAAQFADKAELQKMGNAAIIKLYNDNIDQDAEVLSVSALKALNYRIKAGEDVAIPTYRFKNGVKVIPVYGAGLWGPVWGYIAVDDADGISIVGAYFDHESETPGLGGKIKDDPSFRASFKGEKIGSDSANPFDIVKGGSPAGDFGDSKVDAITGATMTSKGLDAAMDVWLGAYVKSSAKEDPRDE